jgi:hypothetical protein
MRERPAYMKWGAYFAIMLAIGALIYLGVRQSFGVVQAHKPNSPKEVTRLDTAIANARQIRQALATPVAVPEPLPPLSEKPARTIENARSPSQRTARAPDSRSAFAAEPRRHRAYSVFDRFAPH